MLRFENVTIHIKGKTIVKDVCFTASSGRITVLLGKNGAGKSTLIRCLSGLQRYTGQILLGGRELMQYAPRQRAELMSFLPQILPETAMTVEELLELGRCPHAGVLGRMSDIDREAIEVAMVQAGVSEWRHRAVNTLSGGERQRAFMGMMLASGGDMMVLDEPTAFMDPPARREMYSLLGKLKEQGKTIFVTLHDLAEAVRLADDIVVLENDIRFCGSKEQCLLEGVLEQVFDVQKYESAGEIFYR